MKLLDLIVEFSTKGFEAVKSAMATTEAVAQAADAAASQLTTTMGYKLAEAGKRATDSISGMVVEAKQIETAFAAGFRNVKPAVDELVTRMQGFKLAAAATDEAMRRSLVLTQGQIKDLTFQLVAARSAYQSMLHGGAGSDMVKTQIDKVKDLAAAIRIARDRAAEMNKGLTGGGLTGALAEAERGLVKLRAAMPRSWAESFGNLNVMLGELTKGINAVGVHAQRAFTVATASLTGFVVAGLRGTSMGELLSDRMQQLSRQIASLFVPEMLKAVNVIEQAVLWFQRLDGEQQRNIKSWVLGGVAALGVMSIMPKVFTAIMTVVGGIQVLTAAIAEAGVAAGIASGGLVPLIGAIVTLGAGLATMGFATEKGRELFGKLKRAVEPIIKSLWEIAQVVGQALEPILDEVVATIAEIAAGAGDVLQEWLPIIKEVVVAVADLLLPVLRVALNLWKAEAQTIQFLLKAIAVVIKEIAEFLSFLISPMQRIAESSTAWANQVKQLIQDYETLARILVFAGGVAAGIAGNIAISRFLRGQQQRVTDETNRRRTPTTELQPAGGQFEAITEAWRRLQSAVQRTDVDHARVTAENTGRVADATERMATEMGRLQPGMA